MPPLNVLLITIFPITYKMMSSKDPFTVPHSYREVCHPPHRTLKVFLKPDSNIFVSRLPKEPTHYIYCLCFHAKQFPVFSGFFVSSGWKNPQNYFRWRNSVYSKLNHLMMFWKSVEYEICQVFPPVFLSLWLWLISAFNAVSVYLNLIGKNIIKCIFVVCNHCVCVCGSA